MLISIIGGQCSGKKSIANHLIEKEGFTLVTIHNKQSPSTSTSTSDSTLTFPSPASLLEYATTHWRDQLVTLDLNTKQQLEIGFDKRPFFLLLAVQAPVLIRWKRLVKRSKASNVDPGTLESFLEKDDGEIYGSSNPTSSTNGHLNGIESLSLQDSTLSPNDETSSNNNLNSDHLTTTTSTSTDQLTPSNSALSLPISSRSSNLHSLLQSSSLTILNDFPSLASLSLHLTELNLSSTHRLRPSWDTYFIKLCSLASQRSNCMKRRVGAILIRNNRVLSTGYNGTPRGLINCNQGGCERCNLGKSCGSNLDECLCLHAEENALLECGRSGGGVEGAVLYCNTCPCLRCAVKIVQTGVKEVIYQLEYSVDDRTRSIFEESGVLFRRYQDPI